MYHRLSLRSVLFALLCAVLILNTVTTAGSTKSSGSRSSNSSHVETTVPPCEPWLCVSCPNDRTICEECETGFQPVEGKCVRERVCNVKGCETCFAAAPDRCRTCENGYGLTQNMTCAECAGEGCEDCPFNTEQCSRCMKGYALVGQMCVRAVKCDVVNCLKCRPYDPRTCELCDSGYELIEGKCVSKRACNVEGCRTCFAAAADRCRTCENGYGLTQNMTCAKCAGEGCEDCPFNTERCSRCMEGYVLVRGLSTCERAT